MGFTLRKTLDLFHKMRQLSSPSWCPQWWSGIVDRSAVGGHPLKDKRVRVETGDVVVTLSSCLGQFDAVLLDVDNGPTAFTASNNTGSTTTAE